jgi:hypothetical protein
MRKHAGRRDKLKAWLAEAKVAAERVKEAKLILILQAKATADAIASQAAAQAFTMIKQEALTIAMAQVVGGAVVGASSISSVSSASAQPPLRPR